MAQAQAPRSIHEIELPQLDGKPARLSDYAGKVVLVVNVASRCGFTPQYGGLQAIHDRYADRGFTVLGFPSPARPGWTAEQRADELAAWAAKLSEPSGRAALDRQVLATFAQRGAWEEKHSTLEREALEAKLRRGSLARALGWRLRAK